MEKYALGLYTVSAELGLGLSNFSEVSRYQTWPLGRDLSTHLHSHLAEFIVPQTLSDLTWIAVAKGPGSFTGTRIGVVVARTLAQQLDIPLFSISTLTLWAQTYQRENNATGLIAVEMPAQRDHVYGAVYRSTTVTLEPLIPETTLTVDQWQKTVAELDAHPIRIGVTVSVESVCQTLLSMAYQQWQSGDRPLWSEALPFYG